MRFFLTMIALLIISGCGVSKSVHEMALNDIQRLNVESEAQKEKIGGLEKELAAAKKDIEGLVSKKSDMEVNLEKAVRDLEQCRTDSAARGEKIKELEVKEKELIQLKVDVRTVKERASGLLEMIEEISR